MPYAQQHYPFENKELFESTFPADFVSEGIDQTRGTLAVHLHVLVFMTRLQDGSTLFLSSRRIYLEGHLGRISSSPVLSSLREYSLASVAYRAY